MIKNTCAFQANEPLRSSLRRASNGYDFFDALSNKHTYCNWIHLSFLEIIADCYKNNSLRDLIQSYKQVVFTKSLREVWNSLPHSSKNNEINNYYSEIKQSLMDRNPDDMTIQELLDSQPQLTMALLIGVENFTCLTKQSK